LAVDGRLAANEVISYGTVTGSGTITGDFRAGGIVAPGDGTAILTVEGRLDLDPGGTYRCEIGQWDPDVVPDPWDPIPPAGPVNDKLHATADVQLGGTLNLVAIDRLQPAPNEQRWYGDQTRAILTADDPGDIAGSFTDGVGAGYHLGHGIFLTDQGENLQGVTYGSHVLKVDLLQAAVGDVDGNRRVDFGDVWALLTGGLYNVPDPEPPATWPQGDVNEDGNVNFADVWDLLTGGHYNMGDYTAKHAGLTAVPEPGTIAILLTALPTLLLWRRRRAAARVAR